MKNNDLDMNDTGLNHEQLSNLRNASVHPPADAWHKVQHGIRKKDRLIFLYRAVAVVVLAGTATLLFRLSFSGNDPVEHLAENRLMETPVVPEQSLSDVVQVEPEPSASVEIADVADPVKKSTGPEVKLQPEAVVQQDVAPSGSDALISASSPEPVAAKLDEMQSVSPEVIPADAPVTIIYELPASEEIIPKRQATAARLAGFAADLKSGQANIGLFRTIRHVLIEPTRRQLQQNTNLQ